MTQPPENEPESQPGYPSYPQQPAQPQQPYSQAQSPYGQPQQPYGQAQNPYRQPQPPYGQPEQQPYGAVPQYGGAPGYSAYQDPAIGLASGGARLGAAVIDLIIVAIVGNLITAPFVDWHQVFHPGDGGTVSVTGSGFANLLGLALSICYYALLHALWNGQTLGKKALGIRVVRADDRGAISMGQAFGRSMLFELAWIVCCIGQIANLIMVFSDTRHQTIHDKVIKTVVVKVNPGDPNPYA